MLGNKATYRYVRNNLSTIKMLSFKQNLISRATILYIKRSPKALKKDLAYKQFMWQ